MQQYSELRASKRVDLAAAAPLAAPFAVFIEPTNVCNFKCVMCPESFSDYSKLAGYYQRMPMELYRKVLSDLGEIGPVKSLKFYFEGEPLANPDLESMIRMAKNAGVADRIELTTNLSLLNAERAAKLVASGVDYIRISIYSMDPISHRRLTGSKFVPDDITSRARLLRDARDRIGSPTPILYAEYLHESPEGESRFRHAYAGVVDEIGVDYRHNWNGADARSNELVQIGYAPDNKGAEWTFRHKKQACPQLFYTMAVKANGDVSPCCVDWQGTLNIGNVMHQSIRDIWTGAALRNLQRLHISKRRDELPGCRDCTFVYKFPDNLDRLTSAEFEARL